MPLLQIAADMELGETDDPDTQAGEIEKHLAVIGRNAPADLDTHRLPGPVVNDRPFAERDFRGEVQAVVILQVFRRLRSTLLRQV